MLTLEFDSEIPAFLSAVTPALETKPAIHSFMLSLAKGVHDRGQKASLLVRGLGNGGLLEIAGLQTDPLRPMSVSLANPDTAKSLAQELQSHIPSLSGVIGPLPTVEAFAETWSKHRNCGTKLITNLRLFLLESVTPPRAPSGSWREANSNDENLIVQWFIEFGIVRLRTLSILNSAGDLWA